jgi:hypothetical protein
MAEVQYSTCSIRYRYGESLQDSVDIRYRYEAIEAETSTTDIVYRYSRDGDTVRYPRQYGFWAWSTQEIGNLFPHWHMARHNPGGNTQVLINAWGMSQDEMKLNYAAYRKSLFIGTADTGEPDVFYYAPVFDHANIRRGRRKNLLQNPSFTIPGLARARLPAHWSRRVGESTADIRAVGAPVHLGSYAIRIEANNGERAYFDQRVTDTIPKGQPITASIWYMVPMAKDAVETDPQVASLAMFVLYADGTMESSRTGLRLGTDGLWRRASTSLTPTKTVVSIDFAVTVWNETGYTLKIYLGGPQLELNSGTSEWEDRAIEKFPYLRDEVISEPVFDVYLDYGGEEETEELVAGTTISYISNTRRKLIYVRDFDTLWYGVLPSRATLTSVTTVPSATQRTTLGWIATPENDPTMSTDWRIASNRLEQFNRNVSHEVFGSFAIAEFWLDDWYNDLVGLLDSTEDSTFSRTLETLCVYQNRILLVCLETLNGETFRVLKFINPHSMAVNPNAHMGGATPMYLESMGDVDLGLSSGSADYIGVVDSDPNQLLIRISGTYYTVDLEWDYYTFDDLRGYAILRTPPGEGEVVTV